MLLDPAAAGGAPTGTSTAGASSTADGLDGAGRETHLSPAASPATPPAASRASSGGGSTYLAIDIGGTTIKGAAVSDDGTIVVEAPVPTGRGAEALKAVRTLVQRLTYAAAAAGTGEVRSIGIAVPGVIDTTSGTVEYAANLGWTGLRLGDLLRRDLGVLVRVEHDARAGALAHIVDQSADPASSFVFIPVGTGISAGVVIAGRIIGGAAGEFGHVPAVPGGDRCTCGGRGCVEAYASAHNIVRRYRARTTASSQDLTAADIIARTGTDPIAQQVWEEGIQALASGVIGVTALLDPTRIVLGGGVSRAGEKLLGPLTRALHERMPWRSAPRLQISPYLDRAPLIGAAALALRGIVDSNTVRGHLHQLNAQVARSAHSPTGQVSPTP